MLSHSARCAPLSGPGEPKLWCLTEMTGGPWCEDPTVLSRDARTRFLHSLTMLLITIDSNTAFHSAVLLTGVVWNELHMKVLSVRPCRAQ